MQASTHPHDRHRIHNQAHMWPAGQMLKTNVPISTQCRSTIRKAIMASHIKDMLSNDSYDSYRHMIPQAPANGPILLPSAPQKNTFLSCAHKTHAASVCCSRSTAPMRLQCAGAAHCRTRYSRPVAVPYSSLAGLLLAGGRCRCVVGWRGWSQHIALLLWIGFGS